MDPRVLDIPYLGRTALVKGVIVPKRAEQSAATYATIWDEKTGSPLMYYSELQREMIATYAAHGQKHDIDSFDHVLFSYHGLPVRQLGKVDPSGEKKCPEFGCESCQQEKKPYCYLSHCYATTRAIVAKLNLPKEKYTLCFQSRLGKTPWIQPYTSDTLHNLATKGVKRLLVFSPAFVADCIETLDEILVEYGNEFKELGGEEVAMVESLNDDPQWINVLKRLAQEK